MAGKFWIQSCWVVFVACAAGSGAWAKSSASGDPGYTWKSCQRPDLGNVTIPFDAQGNFRPECAPDTVYHWGNSDNIKGLAPLKGAPSAMSFAFLYTWRTPLGSLQYGDVVARIKLKPGSKFVFAGLDLDSRMCSPGENDIRVAARPVSNYWVSEYILCSPDVVESWSYGQPEIAEEMKKEREWDSRAQNGDELDTFFKSKDKSIAEHFNGGNDAYAIKLQKQLDLATSNSGKIYFAAGVSRDPQAHFSTKVPGYFNAKMAAQASDPNGRCEPPSSDLTPEIAQKLEPALDVVRH